MQNGPLEKMFGIFNDYLMYVAECLYLCLSKKIILNDPECSRAINSH